MSKFKFSLGSFFKRKAFDPTEFQTINEIWDETTSGNSSDINNVSATGTYRNTGLPLAERIKQAVKELEELDNSLPNLND